MKIVYLISAVSSDNTGQGGHYYSARSISEAMERAGHEVFLIVMGDIYPKAYDDIKNKVKFVEFNGFNYISFFRKVKAIFKEIQPDSIHSFDNKSFFIARVNSFFIGAGLVLTKPGGPNPTKFFPKCQELVTFSGENRDYFASQNKFKRTNIHLIPNRVEPFECDQAAIKELSAQLSGYANVITRIGRIGKSYRDVISQTGNLVKYLRENDISVVGVVIGVVESKEIFDQLKEEYRNELQFFTAPEYTNNASRFIELGEFSVGTGRSLMEAACKSRVLMTTLKNSKYPVLLNESNYRRLMNTNFSPRNFLEEFSEADSLNEFLVVFRDDDTNKEYKQFSSRLAKDFFDLDSAIPLYENIYLNSAQDKLADFFDVLLNSVALFYYYGRVTYEILLNGGRFDK